jgi:hypothetical protein
MIRLRTGTIIQDSCIQGDYPKGFWWNVLISSSRRMASQLMAANIPINMGGSVHDCKFVISDGKRRYGLVACDYGRAEPAWLEGAANSAKQFRSEYSTQRVAFVVRRMKGAAPQFLPGTRVPLIVGNTTSAISDAFADVMHK